MYTAGKTFTSRFFGVTDHFEDVDLIYFGRVYLNRQWLFKQRAKCSSAIYVVSAIFCAFKLNWNVNMVNLRIAHLRIGHMVGNPEVGNPEPYQSSGNI